MLKSQWARPERFIDDDMLKVLSIDRESVGGWLLKYSNQNLAQEALHRRYTEIVCKWIRDRLKIDQRNTRPGDQPIGIDSIRSVCVDTTTDEEGLDFSKIRSHLKPIDLLRIGNNYLIHRQWIHHSMTKIEEAPSMMVMNK